MPKRILGIGSMVSLFLFMILLCSCSVNKVTVSPQEQLEKEINKWQSFHMEGMAEINISSFAVRRYFICQKYSHSLQFDLVNTGLLGAEPAPLVTIKVDTLLTIDSPYQEMVQDVLARLGLKQVDYTRYLDFKELLKDKKAEIIGTRKTTIENYDLIFNKKMQIIQITSHNQKQNVTVQYRKSEPKLVTVDIRKLAKIRLQVEQFVNTSCCDTLMNLPQNQR